MKPEHYAYKIIPHFNIVVRYFKGPVRLAEVFHSIEELAHETDFLPTMTIINDMREADIHMDDIHVKALLYKIKRTKGFYDRRNVIMLTSQPSHVVFSTLIELLRVDKQTINVFVVSTLEAGLEKIDLPNVFHSLIVKTIEELKTKTNRELSTD